MWIKVIFLSYLLSQIFMKPLICNLVTSGFYFKQTSQVPSNVTDERNVLSETFFNCGKDAKCSHVARSARKGFKVIKSRAELETIEDDDTLWNKSIGKEPDFELISRGKETKQSTTTNDGFSYRAVDGNKNSNFDGGSCTHTNESFSSHWWRVDFARRAMVNKVEITNRGDCCPDRLHNFTIRIGFEDGNSANPICRKNVDMSIEITGEFKCYKTMPGRYLFIESHYTASLTLCEVEVYGYHF